MFVLVSLIYFGKRSIFYFSEQSCLFILGLLIFLTTPSFTQSVVHFEFFFVYKNNANIYAPDRDAHLYAPKRDAISMPLNVIPIAMPQNVMPIYMPKNVMPISMP